MVEKTTTLGIRLPNSGTLSVRNEGPQVFTRGVKMAEKRLMKLTEELLLDADPSANDATTTL